MSAEQKESSDKMDALSKELSSIALIVVSLRVIASWSGSMLINQIILNNFN